MRLALLSLSILIATPCAGAAPPDLARVERLVVEQTNDLRRAEGRSGVATHPRLEAAARELARHMARTGRYGHEADGRTPGARARDHGYRWCSIAENIGYQFSSAGFDAEELAGRLVTGWERSAEHRANMLDRIAVHTAVAVARSEATGYYYAVQLFAAPAVSGSRCR